MTAKIKKTTTDTQHIDLGIGGIAAEDDDSVPVKILHEIKPIGVASAELVQDSDSKRLEERDQVNQLIGQIQMANSFAKFADVVSLQKLAHIKETKAYRSLAGVKFALPDGKFTTVGSWAEFCSALGMSASKVDEDLTNLRSFGEEALEGLSRVGAGYRELRQFRKLPEDEREALIEAAKAGDKDQLLDLAESLISKHTREKDVLGSQIRDRAAEAQKSEERANRLQYQLDDKEDLIETLRNAQNLNPEFRLETNIIREQSALLDQQCAVALAALGDMADALDNEDGSEPEWGIRFQSVWFAAHAAYARALLLVQSLRSMDVDDLLIPADPGEFKESLFTTKEANAFIDEVDSNRIVLAEKLKQKRDKLEEDAPRGPGRPKKVKNQK